MIQNILEVQLKDNVKARVIDSNGVYQRVEREPGEHDFISQHYFMDKALEASQIYNLSNEQMEIARKNQTRKSMHMGPKVSMPQGEVEAYLEAEQALDMSQDDEATLGRFELFTKYLSLAFKALFK